MIEALGTMSVLAHRQDDVVDRLKAAKVVASVLDKRASDALAAVTAATDAAKAAQAAVEQKAAEQAAQVGALNTQVAQLSSALSAARATSTQLSAARASGSGQGPGSRAARPGAGPPACRRLRRWRW